LRAVLEAATQQGSTADMEAISRVIERSERVANQIDKGDSTEAVRRQCVQEITLNRAMSDCDWASGCDSDSDGRDLSPTRHYRGLLDSDSESSCSVAAGSGVATSESGSFSASSRAATPLPSHRPSLLLFAPANDPDFVADMRPRLDNCFEVDVVTVAADGVNLIGQKTYDACVAKLGTKGNLGTTVIMELRQQQGGAAFVGIHSSTAAQQPSMRTKLQDEFGINLFVAHGAEDALVQALEGYAAMLCQPAPIPSSLMPALLFFAPPSDLSIVARLLPQFQDHFDVDQVKWVVDAKRQIATRKYFACIVKLGTQGNLGTDVLRTLRAEQDQDTYVIVHSQTAADNHEIREALSREFNVNLFVSPATEDLLTQKLEELTAPKASGCTFS